MVLSSPPPKKQYSSPAPTQQYSSAPKPYSEAPKPYSEPPKPYSPPQRVSSSGGGGGGGGSAPTTPSTTQERIEALKERGFIPSDGGNVRQLQGGGRIISPSQNLQGSQYVLSGALRSGIISAEEQGLRFSQYTTKERKEEVIKSLKKEGYNVAVDSKGYLSYTPSTTPPVKPSKPVASSSTVVERPYSPPPDSYKVIQTAFFSPPPKSTNVVSAGKVSISTPTPVTRPADTAFYDFLVAPARDVSNIVGSVSRSGIAAPVVAAQRVKEVKSAYNLGSGTVSDVTAGGLVLTSAFPYSKSLAETSQRQSKEISKTVSSFTGTPVPEQVGSGILLGSLTIDAYLSTFTAGSGAKYVSEVGKTAFKVAAKEGLKQAAVKTVPKVGLDIVRTVGAPVETVKLVWKTAPTEKARIAVGAIVTGLGVGSETGLFKTDFGAGVAESGKKLARYVTLTATPKERAEITSEMVIYNAPYYGARVVQAQLPTGVKSRLLEYGYRAANIGVIGVLTASNVAEAKAQGKSTMFGLGKSYGELAFFESLGEEVSIDKAFDVSPVSKYFGRKAASDIAKGVKTEEYLGYFSAIEPEFKGMGKFPSLDFTFKMAETPEGITKSATIKQFTPVKSVERAAKASIKDDFATFVSDFEAEVVKPVARSKEAVDLRKAFTGITPTTKTSYKVDVRPDYKIDMSIKVPSTDITRDITPTIRQRTPRIGDSLSIIPSARTDLTIRPDLTPTQDNKQDIKIDTKYEMDFKYPRAPILPFLPGLGKGGGDDRGETARGGSYGLSGSALDILTIYERKPARAGKGALTIKVTLPKIVKRKGKK